MSKYINPVVPSTRHGVMVHTLHTAQISMGLNNNNNNKLSYASSTNNDIKCIKDLELEPHILTIIIIFFFLTLKLKIHLTSNYSKITVFI